MVAIGCSFAELQPQGMLRRRVRDVWAAAKQLVAVGIAAFASGTVFGRTVHRLLKGFSVIIALLAGNQAKSETYI